MASFAYNEAKRALLQGEIDLATDDIRVILVMSNTTADTEQDVNTISGITTLDECDGANYARKSLANEAVSEGAGKAIFDADDSVWSALGTSGTGRQVVAALVYKHVTNDADSVPLCYLDGTGFPFDGAAADVTVSWHAVNGLLNLS